MTQPQAQEPSAQIHPQYMIGALQQRVAALTEENTMLSALLDQTIAECRRLESETEQLRGGDSGHKESNGAESSTGSSPEGPNAEATEKGGNNGRSGRGGPSPADLARKGKH